MLRAETVGEDHIAIQQDKAINVGKPRGRSDMSIGGNTESKHLMLAENLKQKLASVSGFASSQGIQCWICEMLKSHGM